ncbi:MAG TPA: XRE family transcriptional regulator [Bdellovibrionales bacterium]|nr:transcriptional regulator [Pseudobdellovibrionaceae bacterium]HAG90783.1 XRE family transcriptional regulator [Bdellovibrionales bacterium]|tara:strand:- start:3228 stop:3488 length:261 start_codon:yes stop_codon:yes gene_type:complete
MSRANNKLRKYLKKGREKAGLTQSDVAKTLNYSTSQFISNWERGHANVPLPVLSKLIDLYKLNTNYIIKLLLESSREDFEQELSKN